jgi:membrane protease YdiL (CAAX protease family)
MGAAFALLALRTGNLWASVTAHAVNNLGAVLLVFFFFPAG